MDILKLHTIFVNECAQQSCTDTRSLVPGGMFFALKGDQFNGNDYALKALEFGCKYALVDDPQYLDNPQCLYVENVLEALQQLALYHRKRFNIPVIGLTGSNGKTTTKELLFAALSQQKKVIATEGNLNNHIGVPLTLLRITSATQIAIIEMGANHVGEIALLCTLAEPTHGIITNIGRAHIGLFGGMGNIIKGKTELYEYLRMNGGEVFVYAYDELLLKYSEGIPRTLYGSETEGLYMVKSNHTTPFVSVHWDHLSDIQTKLVGEYNVQNIACAITVASHFNVVNTAIVKGIESYNPQNNRSEAYEGAKGNLVIKDFYNANGDSMEAAIRGAASLSENRPLILILGDMFELGEYSGEEHQRIATLAESYNPQSLFLIGNAFFETYTEKGKKFKTLQEALPVLQASAIEHSVILIKGSRGVHLEELFEKNEW